jgi:spermidine synthase
MSRRARRRKLRDVPAASAVIPTTWWRGTLPVAALLCASGAASLMYETLWVRQLGRVVGVEVHAVSIALSAFFAGLALGGGSLGRLADRVVRPVRLYALLEAGVAALGVISTLALARAAPLFVALQDAVGPLAWVLPFGMVGVPAILMGGTLPALFSASRARDSSRRRSALSSRSRLSSSIAESARPRRRRHRRRELRHRAPIAMRASPSPFTQSPA